ncbi:hypothetical protein GIB67_036436 [Kingdonia uniflora]|uniref:Cytochrome P450 n=1 Tax=Kingdonia uniflora TaxID=39325 RepID=A0A7J7L495_9MAGN|nr:hypothetical protein GIB67_036436 [Kingdonia uniflora]
MKGGHQSFNVSLSISFAVIFLALVSWFLKVLYSLWWKPKSLERYLKTQGIHGPPYKFMYGNTKDMMELSIKARSKPAIGLSHDIRARVNPFVHQTMINYGKVFLNWLGPTPQLVVMDQKLINEILTNNTGDFLKVDIIPSLKLLTSGLPQYDGDKWAKHRRILNPAFHIEKLKQMMPAFITCCDELITKWEEMVSRKGSCELDVAPEFQTLSGNVISLAAFGSSFKEGRRILELQKEQSKLFMRELYSGKSIKSRFIPTKESKRMVEIYEEVRTLFREFIEMRKKSFGTGNTNNNDLLGLLLESNLNEEFNYSKSRTLTMDDVIEECKAFYSAGQVSTADLLTWTMIVLSMHPSWQERAREEVLQVIGNKKPSFDDLNHLKILIIIFYEVLRLYPPTSLVRRTWKTATKLGDFSLPANTQITIPLVFVHRDTEQIGDDANEFNPERFSEGISRASKDQASYFPFSGGPRVCIGKNFALLEAKMALTNILQHFSFELSPTYTHAPSGLPTLQPQHGAQIILHKL